MVKILMGSKNVQLDLKKLEFLNSTEYELITSNTGIDTIEKCKIISPDIIMLNSNIPDITYTDVIDKISMLPNEYDKCNLILTVKNKKDKLLLNNTSIIYKIFDNPLDKNKAKETINYLKVKFETPYLETKELITILLSLGINTYNISSQYLISAILKCYYHPENFITLDNIYKMVASEFDVSKEKIKNSIRHLIDTFNTSYNICNNSLYRTIFKDTKYISPKQFLEIFVNYLKTIKSKN